MTVTPLASRIRAARLALGLTQQQAAERLKYTNSGYRRIEYGERAPRFSQELEAFLREGETKR